MQPTIKILMLHQINNTKYIEEFKKLTLLISVNLLVVCSRCAFLLLQYGKKRI